MTQPLNAIEEEEQSLEEAGASSATTVAAGLGAAVSTPAEDADVSLVVVGADTEDEPCTCNFCKGTALLNATSISSVTIISDGAPTQFFARYNRQTTPDTRGVFNAEPLQRQGNLAAGGRLVVCTCRFCREVILQTMMTVDFSANFEISNSECVA